MLGLSTKQWAILITALLHAVSLLWFALIKVDYHPDKWNVVRMSFSNEEPIQEIGKKEQWIPKDYKETGLDQRKYSVAKTNEAVNEALNSISKGDQERLQHEIDAQVEAMAKSQSTTGFLEGKQNSRLEGSLSAKANETKEEKKAGNKNGDNKLGNTHNKETNITYYLKNRMVGAKGLYNPIYLCHSGGKIVINITVNNNGDVIHASVNENKTDTKDACLRKAAREAALKSTFNADALAENKQRGIITYSFVSQ